MTLQVLAVSASYEWLPSQDVTYEGTAETVATVREVGSSRRRGCASASLMEDPAGATPLVSGTRTSPRSGSAPVGTWRDYWSTIGGGTISCRSIQGIYAHPQSRYAAPGQIGRASPASQKRALDGKTVVFAGTPSVEGFTYHKKAVSIPQGSRSQWLLEVAVVA